MGRLKTDSNLADPDGIYAALIRMTEGLDDRAAQLATAKLVLLLANHVGDEEVLREAMAIARGAAQKAA
jgi:hypothetical protein